MKNDDIIWYKDNKNNGDMLMNALKVFVSGSQAKNGNSDLEKMVKVFQSNNYPVKRYGSAKKETVLRAVLAKTR